MGTSRSAHQSPVVPEFEKWRRVPGPFLSLDTNLQEGRSLLMLINLIDWLPARDAPHTSPGCTPKLHSSCFLPPSPSFPPGLGRGGSSEGTRPRKRALSAGPARSGRWLEFDPGLREGETLQQGEDVSLAKLQVHCLCLGAPRQGETLPAAPALIFHPEHGLLPCPRPGGANPQRGLSGEGSWRLEQRPGPPAGKGSGLQAGLRPRGVCWASWAWGRGAGRGAR